MQNNIDQILQDPSSWGQYSPALQQALTQLSSNNTNASPQYNQRLSDSTIVGNGDTAVAQDPQNRLSVLMGQPSTQNALSMLDPQTMHGFVRDVSAQPQQQPIPQNYIQNNSTGAVTDVGPSYTESGRPQSATVNGIIQFAQQNNIDPQMVPAMIKYQSSTPNSAPSVTDVYRQSFQSGIPFEQLMAAHMDVAQGNISNKEKNLKLATGNAVLQGQNLENVSKALGIGNSRIPAGYRQTTTGLEAIPGGPADLKLAAQFNHDTAQLQSSFADLDRLSTSANELLMHPGLAGITGIRGAIPNIPGSNAADAQARLFTLKSQVGFGVLQAMRNASKTGGALGNVSDAEGKRLEANLTALENAQSEKQFKEQLGKIITFAQGAKDRLANAYNLAHGIQSATATNPSGAIPTSVNTSALPKTTTQAEVQATAAKYGVPVAKVIADAKAKGYTVQ